MTTVTMITNTAPVTDAQTSFSNTVRSLWTTMKIRNRQRRAVRHLRSMSEHHLRDVGIHRSEINFVVYGRDDDKKT